MICSHVALLGISTRHLPTIPRYTLRAVLIYTRYSTSRDQAIVPRPASPIAAPITTQYGFCSHIVPSLSTVSGLKASELSRAAAQAVRLSTRNEAFADALFIVNSLHLAGTVGCPPSLGPTAHLQAPDIVPVPTSPRLSAHCLLHALLRSGRAQQAARLSETMMKQGLRVHSRTLQCVIQELCRSVSRVHHSFTLSSSSFNLSGKSLESEDDFLLLLASHTEDPCFRAALRILKHARRCGQHRKRQMYDALIKACLLQGEIIVASLLFVLLVKEFTVKRPTRASPTSEHDAVDPCLRAEPTHVPLQSFKLMLRDIHTVFLRDPQNVDDETRLRHSTQALANLAMLLEQDEFLSGNISTIIRALYSYPKVDTQIWILREGKSRRVAAYPYFQRVLAQIIRRMKVGASPLPHLDLKTYNTLLFYALRHRLSPSMASTILQHMSTRSLQPSIATYNILLRSATLLRIPYVATKLLTTLKFSVPSTLLASQSSSMPSSTTSSQFTSGSAIVPRRRQEVLHIPESLIMAFAHLKPDMYTLTTYISHLTATGHPQEVQELIYQLLPELRMSLQKGLSPGTKTQLHKLCLKRAVIYGPYFFTTLLNALVKAGLTGTAERMWILAQQAQYASWVPGFVADVKPWSLSIHAYTVLMQCYAAEASKSYAFVDSDTPTIVKRRVCGYGRFVYTRKQLRTGKSRRAAGYRSGILLFRAVVSGSRTMHKTISRTQGGLASTMPLLTPPAADARFYNATLDVVQAGQRGMNIVFPTRHGATARHCLRVGSLTPLQQIADSIRTAGYAFPTHFQSAVDIGPVESLERPRPLDRSLPGFRAPLKVDGSRRLPVLFSRSLDRRRVQQQK